MVKSSTRKRRPGPGRPVVLSISERRKRVLGAMDELFSEGGIDGLTISTIASKVKMSRRTLYEIFGDRETLLLAYLGDKIAERILPLDDAQRRLPLRERLMLMLWSRKECGTWELPLAILRLAIGNASAAPSIALSCLEVGSLRVQTLIREELDRSVARGELRPMDTGLAAGILRDMIHPAIIDVLLDPGFRPDDAQRKARMDMALDIFLDGLGTGPRATDR